MNEKQLSHLREYITNRIDVQKTLLEKSKDENQYHLGAIMELMGIEERIKLILEQQPLIP
jgi:hypothetical protein